MFCLLSQGIRTSTSVNTIYIPILYMKQKNLLTILLLLGLVWCAAVTTATFSFTTLLTQTLT